MGNYLAYFDSDWLRHCDLEDRPRTVTIAKVEAGELRNGKGKSRKPVVHFREFPKPLALNKTNGKAIASLYSNETERWIGQRVELYPARTTFGSEEVDCVRVRGVKNGNGRPAPAPAPPAEEPAEDTGEAPTGAALADLRDTFKALTWKRQQQDMWCKERFGRIQEGLTAEQIKTALKLLMVMGTPDAFAAALAEEKGAGRCL